VCVWERDEERERARERTRTGVGCNASEGRICHFRHSGPEGFSDEMTVEYRKEEIEGRLASRSKCSSYMYLPLLKEPPWTSGNRRRISEVRAE
jgi:hypothetical protein